MRQRRVGIGYDIHRLEAGHRLVLGGVEIPFEKGLLGWSDADVIIHAVIDALLGAAALGDIGTHFPPGDQKYRSISSLILLQETRKTLIDHGWQVVNIDVTVVAEEPKLAPFVDKMRKQVSQTLGIEEQRIGLKATTNEGLGPIGRGEAIAAHAAALIEEVK